MDAGEQPAVAVLVHLDAGGEAATQHRAGSLERAQTAVQVLSPEAESRGEIGGR
ncbi:hypothetical protein D3C83_155790 [compost metagenome]